MAHPGIRMIRLVEGWGGGRECEQAGARPHRTLLCAVGPRACPPWALLSPSLIKEILLTCLSGPPFLFLFLFLTLKNSMTCGIFSTYSWQPRTFQALWFLPLLHSWHTLQGLEHSLAVLWVSCPLQHCVCTRRQSLLVTPEVANIEMSGFVQHDSCFSKKGRSKKYQGQRGLGLMTEDIKSKKR